MELDLGAIRRIGLQRLLIACTALCGSTSAACAG